MLSVLTCSIGDSLTSLQQSACVADVVRDLQVVLEAMFNILFVDAGNSLAHGIQEDGHSCGICTVNAFEHALFGVPLFTPQTSRLLRMQYFLRLTESHLDESVSANAHDANVLRVD